MESPEGPVCPLLLALIRVFFDSMTPYIMVVHTGHAHHLSLVLISSVYHHHHYPSLSLPPSRDSGLGVIGMSKPCFIIYKDGMRVKASMSLPLLWVLLLPSTTVTLNKQDAVDLCAIYSRVKLNINDG